MFTSLLSKALKFCEILKKFGENLTKDVKIAVSLEILRKNALKFTKNGAKALKTQRNQEWCKGKNVELEKR